MRAHRLVGISVFALLLTGCGGGGGDSSSGGGGGDTTLGPLTLQIQGTANSTITTSGANVSVIGLAGASFAKVQLNLPPMGQTTAETIRRATRIAYIDEWQQVYIYSYATGESYRLLSAQRPIEVQYVCWIGKGSRLLLSATDRTTHNYILATVNADGSGYKQIASSSYMFTGVAASPDGTRYAVGEVSSSYPSLFVFDTNGGSTLIVQGTADTNVYRPKWMADGRIAFQGYNQSTNFSRIYAVKPDGSGQTDIGYFSMVLYDFSVSPSTQAIAILENTSSVPWLRLRALNNPYNYYAENLGSSGASAVDWAPDGNAVIYTSQVNSNFQLIFSDLGTTQPRALGPNAIALDWGPYVDKWMLVGTSPVLLPSSAGFLFAQSGPDFDSVVAFDATTRTTAKIADVNNGNPSSNLLYDITADTLKALRYTNSLTGVPVTVIDPTKTTTYAKGAIVSLDAQTGQVVTLITHDATGLVAHGSALTGGFLDRWDAKGRHQSLRGIHELKLGPMGVLAP